MKQVINLFLFLSIDSQVHQSITQSKHNVVGSGAPFASSATKELDDLMESLSDFKVRFFET